MRYAPFIAAAVVAAAAPVQVRTLLAASASTLLDCTPFVLLGAAAARLPAGWCARAAPYLGCGCGPGPSARSLPAALLTLMAFGPLVAVARFAGAMLAAARTRDARIASHADDALAQLHSVLLPALAGGAFSALAVPLILARVPPLFAFAAGAAAGLFGAPCALGAVGFAAGLRAASPAAAAGFLCLAGIADVRIFRRAAPHRHCGPDAVAYTIAAIACAFVAARHGAALVHPRLAIPLALSAAMLFALAWRHRATADARVRIAPAIMLAGVFFAAPPPAYHATETTLSAAFAGERVDFTGVLTRTGTRATLVRYAITCCRADAAPVVLRIGNPPALHDGAWLRARGVLVQTGTGLALRTTSIARIAPPADPFVYR